MMHHGGTARCNGRWPRRVAQRNEVLAGHAPGLGDAPLRRRRPPQNLGDGEPGRILRDRWAQARRWNRQLTCVATTPQARPAQVLAPLGRGRARGLPTSGSRRSTAAQAVSRPPHLREAPGLPHGPQVLGRGLRPLAKFGATSRLQLAGEAEDLSPNLHLLLIAGRLIAALPEVAATLQQLPQDLGHRAPLDLALRRRLQGGDRGAAQNPLEEGP